MRPTFVVDVAEVHDELPGARRRETSVGFIELSLPNHERITRRGALSLRRGSTREVGGLEQRALRDGYAQILAHSGAGRLLDERLRRKNQLPPDALVCNRPERQASTGNPVRVDPVPLGSAARVRA